MLLFKRKMKQDKALAKSYSNGRLLNSDWREEHFQADKMKYMILQKEYDTQIERKKIDNVKKLSQEQLRLRRDSDAL